MPNFSDLWQLDSDNEDLEGHEELQFDRSPQQEVDPAMTKRGKRNLLLGLVGFVLLAGWLWIAIAESGGR